MTDRPRYVMFGGFLGAGKTTAVLAYARRLRDAGRRVGLITNDQSVGLVDTRMLAHHGFAVEEITGGCFCCRFGSLVEAAARLAAGDVARPDVLIAEPVGSCTDLRATVTYPLRQIYGDRYDVAPLSVVVDPRRALRVLGLESGRAFSPKVQYVYCKQLEEAELLVINKTDAVEPERLAVLDEALAQRFAHARRVHVSARTGAGLDAWFAAIDGTPANAAPPQIDYDTYAEGEALLGWVNATVRLTSSTPLDGNALLRRLAEALGRRLSARGQAIAHLKMTLSPDVFGGDLGVLNVTAGEGPVEMSHTLHEPLAAGELVVNLRAEGDPQVAREALDGALAETDAALVVTHAEQFRPGRPVPTHRLASPIA